MQAASNDPAHAYDVFNGDADGICALHQLRLAEQRVGTLITGTKRDIDLLRRFQSKRGDLITVLDISLDNNIAALNQHLEAGADITYFDHHNASKAFEHERLHLHCDMAADVCTSLLVNRHLHGRYWKWAVTAAYGDNLPKIADAIACDAGMDDDQREQLHELGKLLNYNAYGESVDDLNFHPEKLYQVLHAYQEPFDFMANAQEFQVLRKAYREDLAAMQGVTPFRQNHSSAIYILPEQPWARRISGILANQLAVDEPGKSFAVLTTKPDGSYVVSVRSGQPEWRPANELCSRFANGGGRRSAAGVNHLPDSDMDDFLQAFIAYFKETEKGN